MSGMMLYFKLGCVQLIIMKKFMVSFSTDDTKIDFFLDDLAGF